MPVFCIQKRSISVVFQFCNSSLLVNSISPHSSYNDQIGIQKPTKTFLTMFLIGFINQIRTKTIQLRHHKILQHQKTHFQK